MTKAGEQSLCGQMLKTEGGFEVATKGENKMLRTKVEDDS